jgi:hypothetical protein
VEETATWDMCCQPNKPKSYRKENSQEHEGSKSKSEVESEQTEKVSNASRLGAPRVVSNSEK